MAYLSVWESEEYSRVKLPGKALQVSVHTFGIMYRCNSGEVFMNTWDQIKTPGTPEDPRKISPGDVLIRYMTAGTTSGLMVTDKGKLLLAFSRIGSQSEFPETVAEIDVPYGFKVRYVNACYNGIILNDSLDKFLFMNGWDGFRQYLKCDGMSRVREEPVIIPLPQSFSQYDPVIDITPFGPYWLILNSTGHVYCCEGSSNDSGPPSGLALVTGVNDVKSICGSFFFAEDGSIFSLKITREGDLYHKSVDLFHDKLR